MKTDGLNTPLSEPAIGSCFWRHAWSKWEQYAVAGKKVLLDGAAHPCTFTKQKRMCLRCNKMEVEDVAG